MKDQQPLVNTYNDKNLMSEHLTPKLAVTLAICYRTIETVYSVIRTPPPLISNESPPKIAHKLLCNIFYNPAVFYSNSNN